MCFLLKGQMSGGDLGVSFGGFLIASDGGFRINLGLRP